MARIPGCLREVWWFQITIVMIATPILLTIMLPFHDNMGLTQKECNCLYVLCLMAVYWCTETLPLAVTALLPLVLCPLMGIQTADLVARNYLKDLNMLFLAGLMLAVAIEHSGLHRRIALGILRLVGTNLRLLMLGFMLPTWFLSMWISNTAATAMMIAMVQAVIVELQTQGEDQHNNSDPDRDLELYMKEPENFNSTAQIHPTEYNNTGDKINENSTSHHWKQTAKALSLCVAYAATCGGIATLTGTPPNIVLNDNVNRFGEQLKVDFGVNFASWMGFAVPVSFIMVLGCWIWLQILYVKCRYNCKLTDEESGKKMKRVITREYYKLGSMKWKESVTLFHFVLLAILWLTRNPGGVGGWGQLFPKKFVSDATAGLLIIVSLFMVPSERPNFCCWRGGCGSRDHSIPEPREAILTWNVVTHKVPWWVIIMLGGGFALADSITVSGLSVKIGDSLQLFQDWPVWLIILCLSVLTAAITEVMSNTAVSTIFLPIVGDMAVSLGKNPLLFMFPVCVSSSFAFMLPVATAPNALVFATNVLKIKDMATSGIVLNIVGVFLVTGATLSWGAALFDLTNLQTYANITEASVTTTWSANGTI